MKYYECMVDMGCFSRSELARRLNCGNATAANILSQYVKKGYIERVRRDFYVVISLENKQPVLSRYEIGSRLFPDAIVSHHSAFEVYGYANQVFYDVYVTCNNRFKMFDYDNVTYRRIAPKGNVLTQKTNGVTVTTIEQTVIDSIYALDKIGGLEELLRCLLLIPSLNESRLRSALEVYGNGFLYQKTGYLLEQLNDTFKLSPSFITLCKERVPRADRYLTKEHSGYVYNPEWRLVAPRDVTRIINKGVNSYNAV